MNSDSMVSEKYLAGFLDADGSIGVYETPGKTAQLRLTFSQKRSQDAVIHMIHRDYGGALIARHVGEGEYTDLVISSKKARMILERIRNHLVIKRRYAEWALDVCSKPCADWEALKVMRKQVRRERSNPLPNYPSRKWMAGYFDGDGCFSVNLYKPTGNASAVLTIAAAEYDTEGIELIHKAFGGNIFNMCEGRVRQWRMNPDAAKLKSMLPHFVPNMIVKRDQGEFLLKCAAMGHLRDGENIKAALKRLKLHPHRLSESAPASDEIGTVRDLRAYKRTDYGDFVRNAKGHIVGKVMRQSEAPVC